MDKQEYKQEDINIRITKRLKKQYKGHCLALNVGMSKHIRQLIEQELKNANNKVI